MKGGFKRSKYRLVLSGHYMTRYGEGAVKRIVTRWRKETGMDDVKGREIRVVKEMDMDQLVFTAYLNGELLKESS